MAERASLFQRIQVGVESTSGTLVPAMLELASLSIEPSVKVEVDTFRPMGRKFATFTSLGKEWTEASLKGKATYTEMVYPLASVLGRGAIAVAASNANGTAYTWRFSPKTNTADNPATFTVEQGSQERAHRFGYGIVNDFEVSWKRDNIEISGAMIGRRLEDNIRLSGNEIQTIGANATVSAGSFTLNSTMGTTGFIPYNGNAGSVQTRLDTLLGVGNTYVSGGPMPTAAVSIEFTGAYAQTDVPKFIVAGSASMTGGTLQAAFTSGGTAPAQFNLVPVLPTQVNVYMGTSIGHLNSATALQRVMSASWKISGRYGPLWTLDAAQQSWVAIVETEPKLELSMMMEADAEGMAILPLVRSGETRYVRLEAVGGTVNNTTSTYLARFDTAIKFTDVGNFSDADGVYAVEYTATGVSDTSNGGTATVITIRNELASL
jgi:hypothetical protein